MINCGIVQVEFQVLLIIEEEFVVDVEGVDVGFMCMNIVVYYVDYIVEYILGYEVVGDCVIWLQGCSGLCEWQFDIMQDVVIFEMGIKCVNCGVVMIVGMEFEGIDNICVFQFVGGYIRFGIIDNEFVVICGWIVLCVLVFSLCWG